MKEATHTMEYGSGGGTWYDGGKWKIKETDKTVTFECVGTPFFELCCPEKMVIKKEKEHRHCLRDWEDGSYTVYPNQSGVPHLFSPIRK